MVRLLVTFNSKPVLTDKKNVTKKIRDKKGNEREITKQETFYNPKLLEDRKKGRGWCFSLRKPHRGGETGPCEP